MNIIRKQKRDKMVFFWAPFAALEALLYVVSNYALNKALGVELSLSVLLKYHLAKFLIILELDKYFLFTPAPDFLRYLELYFPHLLHETPAQIDADYYIYAAALVEQKSFFSVYSWFLPLTICAGVVALSIYSYRVHHTSIRDDDKFLSGTRRVTQRQLAAFSRRVGGDGLPLDLSDGSQLILGREALPRHLLVLGATGTGKSQLLLQFLPRMIQNHEGLKCVVVDVKGEFIDYLYRPGIDVIFNPFDSRTAGYNFFRELSIVLDHNIETETEPPEVRMIASALADVASHENDSNKWVFEGVANIFYSAIMHCYINNQRTMRDFINFLRLPEDDIKKAFDALPRAFGSPGSNELVGDSEAKQNVATELRKANTKLSALLEHDGDFSIKEFMTQPGNLYLSRAGANAKNFDAVFKLMLDLFARYVRTGTDSKKLKYLMLIDEFGELPALSELSDLIRLSRSKGCCILLANQTIAKIREKYNEKGTADILGNINSRFYFKIKEQSEAKYVSENIGSARIERTSTSDNTSSGQGLMSGRDGDSESQSIVTEPAFPPEEIMSLPVGHCVPDIAGMDAGADCHVVGLVKFALQDKLKHKNEPFVDYYAELEEQQRAKKEKEPEKIAEPSPAPEPTEVSAPDPEPVTPPAEEISAEIETEEVKDPAAEPDEPEPEPAPEKKPEDLML